MRVLCIAVVVATCWAEGPGVLPQARRLAAEGKRGEALELLDRHLAAQPRDHDARTLRGTVLSWERRFDEARRDLGHVLDTNRDNADALSALINVEIWSNHLESAEKLARQAVVRDPDNALLLEALARSLTALGKRREAMDIIRHLLEIDPRNRQARQLMDGLEEELPIWTASVVQTFDWFSDGRALWNETQVSLARQTQAGAFIGRFSRANRFSSTSQMMEVDAYPRFRRGTYAFLNAGYSSDAVLYPRYRLGGDLFQSAGRGFEVSGGFRRLGFDGKVNIYNAGVSKYHGPWMFSGRGIFAPNAFGDSRTWQFAARRYFSHRRDYVGARVSIGALTGGARSLQDIEVLRSESVAFEWNHRISRRWFIAARGGWAAEDRLNRQGLHRINADGGVDFRF